ncbi:hypothetical protein HDU76_001066 [Blyttiomyces sp. JEL0837]|nr:hypothetical protein HDU76_001066 [Blyttiomyces sp. JEL0837]
MLADSKFFSKVVFQALVCDEGHRLKNDEGRTFLSLAANLKAVQRVILTGTPLQNNIRELFNIMNFLNPEKWNDPKSLADEYDVINDDNVGKLHELLKPHFLRRTKRQVLQSLPPKAEILIPVELTSLQKELYKAVLAKNYMLLRSLGVSKSQGEQRVASIQNILMELRKLCNHPYLVKNVVPEGLSREELHRSRIAASGKLLLLQPMLKALKQAGHRVLIFSQFKLVLNELEPFLYEEGHLYIRIDGETIGGSRHQLIESFNTHPEIFVLLLTTRTGGTGINLTSADTIILFDDLQAMARVHRIGQTKPVVVYKLFVRDTVEERILDVAKRKLVLDHLVVENMDSNKLDKEELSAIIRFGAQKLFSEKEEAVEQQALRYDDASIARLVDREAVISESVEKEKAAEAAGEAKEKKGLSFSFAKVWTMPEEENKDESNNGDALVAEMETGEQNDGSGPKPSDNDHEFWDKLLKERIQKAAVLAAQTQVLGKRARKVIDYAYTTKRRNAGATDGDPMNVVDEDEMDEGNGDSDHDFVPDEHVIETDIGSVQTITPLSQSSISSPTVAAVAIPKKQKSRKQLEESTPSLADLCISFSDYFEPPKNGPQKWNQSNPINDDDTRFSLNMPGTCFLCLSPLCKSRSQCPKAHDRDFLATYINSLRKLQPVGPDSVLSIQTKIDMASRLIMSLHKVHASASVNSSAIPNVLGSVPNQHQRVIHPSRLAAVSPLVGPNTIMVQPTVSGTSSASNQTHQLSNPLAAAAVQLHQHQMRIQQPVGQRVTMSQPLLNVSGNGDKPSLISLPAMQNSQPPAVSSPVFPTPQAPVHSLSTTKVPENVLTSALEEARHATSWFQVQNPATASMPTKPQSLTVQANIPQQTVPHQGFQFAPARRKVGRPALAKPTQAIGQPHLNPVSQQQGTQVLPNQQQAGRQQYRPVSQPQSQPQQGSNQQQQPVMIPNVNAAQQINSPPPNPAPSQSTRHPPEMTILQQLQQQAIQLQQQQLSNAHFLQSLPGPVRAYIQQQQAIQNIQMQMQMNHAQQPPFNPYSNPAAMPSQALQHPPQNSIAPSSSSSSASAQQLQQEIQQLVERRRRSESLTQQGDLNERTMARTGSNPSISVGVSAHSSPRFPLVNTTMGSPQMQTLSPVLMNVNLPLPQVPVNHVPQTGRVSPPIVKPPNANASANTVTDNLNQNNSRYPVSHINIPSNDGGNINTLPAQGTGVSLPPSQSQTQPSYPQQKPRPQVQQFQPQAQQQSQLQLPPQQSQQALPQLPVQQQQPQQSQSRVIQQPQIHQQSQPQVVQQPQPQQQSQSHVVQQAHIQQQSHSPVLHQPQIQQQQSQPQTVQQLQTQQQSQPQVVQQPQRAQQPSPPVVAPTLVLTADPWCLLCGQIQGPESSSSQHPPHVSERCPNLVDHPESCKVTLQTFYENRLVSKARYDALGKIVEGFRQAWMMRMKARSDVIAFTVLGGASGGGSGSGAGGSGSESGSGR